VRIGSGKVVEAATPADDSSGAGAHGARIEPAGLPAEDLNLLS
jgi:hypothetical protein